MWKKFVQGLLVFWIVMVLATQWILRGGPGFEHFAVRSQLLRTVKNVLTSWFFQPYGS